MVKRFFAVVMIATMVVAMASPLAAFADESLNWDLTLPSLAESFEKRFLFGNIWSSRAQMNDIATHDMFLHHYNAVTASNFHKVHFLLGATPNEWNFDFVLADYIVDWAEENDLAMHFHALVWHNQSRAWLTNVLGTGEPVTRAEAIYNMHRYIREVASRYSGRVRSWDVVNEVIYVQGTWTANPDWRMHMRQSGRGITRDGDSRWYDAFANGAVGDECGSDYIFYAFRFARIYDPLATLYYNDYNEFHAPKREAIAQMVEQVNERWRNDPLHDGRLLIEGIGMQAHYGLRNWPANVNLVRQAIERFIETGAVISISELNLYLVGGGIVPTPDALPELFVEQATRYRELFNLFLEFSDYIERVTFFIWVDLPAEEGAWRRWPHSQHPALFDLDRQAKPAFHAVLETLEKAEPANISAPFVTTDVLYSERKEGFAARLFVAQTNHAPTLWRVADGALPEGVRLVATTGVLLGTPAREGEFTFTALAENAAGYGVREFTLTVAGGEATITPSPDPIPPDPLPTTRAPRPHVAGGAAGNGDSDNANSE